MRDAFLNDSRWPNECKQAPENHRKCDAFPKEFLYRFWMAQENPKPRFLQYTPCEINGFRVRPGRLLNAVWNDFFTKIVPDSLPQSLENSVDFSRNLGPKIPAKCIPEPSQNPSKIHPTNLQKNQLNF